MIVTVSVRRYLPGGIEAARLPGLQRLHSQRDGIIRPGEDGTEIRGSYSIGHHAVVDA